MLAIARILVVEDDLALSNGIKLALGSNGYQIVQAFSVLEARQRLLADALFNLILLDINLPDGSGLELCQQIRRVARTPIIFLTADDLELDVVAGLEVGGDDYITKPFSLAILRARIAALLRRSEQQAGESAIAIDQFVFDFPNLTFSKNGTQIVLSKTEQKLLRLLVQNRGQTVTRDTLLERVWSDGAEFVDENALSVTVRRLRNKLEDDPSFPKYVQTVYGIGYTWAVR